MSAPYPFGIELDPATLSEEETTLLAERVAWYKEQRALLQFGVLRRGDVGGPAGEGLRQLAVRDGGATIAFRYATRPRTNDWNGLWRVAGLPDGPVRFAPAFDGEPVTLPGAALTQGIQPPHLYEGQAAVAHLRAAG